MARRKRHQRYQDDPSKLEISSLIDICFLLLIYFLATSTLVPRERDLKMRLPRPMSYVHPPSEIRPLFIGVRSDGGIHTGTGASLMPLDHAGEGRFLPLLADHLDLYVAASRGAHLEPLVQIHVEDGAQHQRVVDVLNALAKAEIHSVTFTDLLEM